MQPTDLVVSGVSLSALIMAVVQAAKSTSWFKKHHSPVLAILLGVVAAFLYHVFMHELSSFQTVTVGMAMGLQATGLYETSNMFSTGNTYDNEPMPQPQPYNPQPYTPQPVVVNPTPQPMPQPVVQPTNTNWDGSGV